MTEQQALDALVADMRAYVRRCRDRGATGDANDVEKSIEAALSLERTFYGGGDLYADVKKVHKDWCNNGFDCVRDDCGFWAQLSSMVDSHDMQAHTDPPNPDALRAMLANIEKPEKYVVDKPLNEVDGVTGYMWLGLQYERGRYELAQEVLTMIDPPRDTQQAEPER